MKSAYKAVLVFILCICVYLLSVFLPDVRESVRAVVYGDWAEDIAEAFAGMEDAVSERGGFADAVEAFCAGFSD